MALPEEDLPPAWLRDYGDIEADISRMEQFAAKLRAEVTQNYAPHLEYVNDDMTVKLPDPPAGFAELVSFLETHHTSQVSTNQLVHFFRDATGGFATAASEVSANYGQADAFSAARVGEVEAALDRTAAAKPQTPAPDTPPAPPTPAGTNNPEAH